MKVDEQKRERIPLFGDYYLSSDPLNYILEKNVWGKSRKTGEPVNYFTIIGFYTRIDHLISALIEHEAKKKIKTCNDFEDFLIWYKSYSKQIADISSEFPNKASFATK